MGLCSLEKALGEPERSLSVCREAIGKKGADSIAGSVVTRRGKMVFMVFHGLSWSFILTRKRSDRLSRTNPAFI